MALLLQPVFMELQSTEQTDHPNDNDSAKHIAQKVFSSEASEDSLYSMWKVATKVKSVMAEGERFENLTWRAWHRKNQLEKAERERREVELEVARGESQIRSQATAIPRLVARPTTTYSQGYSAILLEIQRASVRAGGPVMADRPYSLDSTQTSTTALTATSPDAAATIESSESTTSNSSVITNKIESSRRRKKNVDKFIKRQQLYSLEKISEQAEEAKNTLLEEKHIMILPKEAPVRHAAAEHSSVGSTNDTISVGSVGEILSRTKEEVDGNVLFRRHGQLARKHASPPHSDRPNVSMLTMLLSKSTAETKRPESCPPPLLGASPPCRPGAPVPSGRMDPLVDSALDSATDLKLDSTLNSSQDLIPSPLPATSSPNRQTGKSASPETRLFSSEESSTPQSANSRRRGLPNPSDYTTPLYIW
ncbi:hypothetical protein PSACC_00798 [Paramicrosporidium saccamoebae]|uniref:Nitrogen regulatory protein areA GATA-like domain-containing protein n=1 Tax=Paramicrosporidium saccamoebae TaxID=1246581 RepID=A0A2H9TNS0_9FUNG|nr:hypothetical protein PSACC_00798 [Paramicrosporidium saccamoebae]